MSKDKDPITVYWSVYGEISNITRLNIAWNHPVKVISTLSKDTNPNKNEYLSCTGMKNFFKNSYTILHPIDSSINFQIDDGKLIPTSGTGFPAWKFFEESSIHNRPRLSYDCSWVFFSEEDLTMELLPPFLHDTADRSGGVVSTGSFNISKWFRPINPDYILWENAKSLSVRAGDPAFYIRFLTDRKIILKQFDLDYELYEIISQALQHKNFFPKESLEKLYDRFIKSNRHKKVIKLIKNNILE